jgi:hypothetical protein
MLVGANGPLLIIVQEGVARSRAQESAERAGTPAVLAGYAANLATASSKVRTGAVMRP